MGTLKERKDVEKENTWATEDIFKEEKEWHEALEQVKTIGKQLQGYQGRLKEAKSLYAFLQLEEELEKVLDDVYCYAMYKSDENTADAHYQELIDKVSSVAVLISKDLSFESVEIMALEEEQLNAFYEEEPGLKVYKRALDDARRSKAHILSEKEETLLAAAAEMGGAPSNISNMLLNADMEYENAVDKEGKEHGLSNGSFISLMQSNDRTLRKSAFTQLYKAYDKVKNTSASILAAQMKKQKFYADARKFDSTLEAALHYTNVDTKVYHNLIQAVHEDIGILHKYMRLRKKTLGLDELHMYDLYVPMVDDCDEKIPFEEAKKNVLASVSVLNKEYADVLRNAFTSRWIDVYENKGKRSGAYSSGARVHPFVLLNYAETLDSEFTLAHEMGHAMHSYLSYHNQPFVDHNYVIFVAEVASTCNEALLMDYLRKHNEDKKVKAYLINYFLEQFRTTLYRQCMFAEFELKINEMIARGETMTAEALSSLYHDLNVFYYGEDVVVDKDIDLEWSRIPHFYMNYYVYQYATGFSAAMALSKRILSGEENAVEDYLNFLKGGCSKSPIELLRGAGVDMASEKPIHEALQLFDSLIDELDELLQEIK